MKLLLVSALLANVAQLGTDAACIDKVTTFGANAVEPYVGNTGRLHFTDVTDQVDIANGQMEFTVKSNIYTAGMAPIGATVFICKSNVDFTSSKNYWSGTLSDRLAFRDSCMWVVSTATGTFNAASVGTGIGNQLGGLHASEWKMSIHWGAGRLMINRDDNPGLGWVDAGPAGLPGDFTQVAIASQSPSDFEWCMQAGNCCPDPADCKAEYPTFAAESISPFNLDTVKFTEVTDEVREQLQNKKIEYSVTYTGDSFTSGGIEQFNILLICKNSVDFSSSLNYWGMTNGTPQKQDWRLACLWVVTGNQGSISSIASSFSGLGNQANVAPAGTSYGVVIDWTSGNMMVSRTDGGGIFDGNVVTGDYTKVAVASYSRSDWKFCMSPGQCCTPCTAKHATVAAESVTPYNLDSVRFTEVTDEVADQIANKKLDYSVSYTGTPGATEHFNIVLICKDNIDFSSSDNYWGFANGDPAKLAWRLSCLWVVSGNQGSISSIASSGSGLGNLFNVAPPGTDYGVSIDWSSGNMMVSRSDGGGVFDGKAVDESNGAYTKVAVASYSRSDWEFCMTDNCCGDAEACEAPTTTLGTESVFPFNNDKITFTEVTDQVQDAIVNRELKYSVKYPGNWAAGSSELQSILFICKQEVDFSSKSNYWFGSAAEKQAFRSGCLWVQSGTQGSYSVASTNSGLGTQQSNDPGAEWSITVRWTNGQQMQVNRHAPGSTFVDASLVSGEYTKVAVASFNPVDFEFCFKEGGCCDTAADLLTAPQSWDDYARDEPNKNYCTRTVRNLGGPCEFITDCFLQKYGATPAHVSFLTSRDNAASCPNTCETYRKYFPVGVCTNNARTAAAASKYSFDSTTKKLCREYRGYVYPDGRDCEGDSHHGTVLMPSCSWGPYQKCVTVDETADITNLGCPDGSHQPNASCP